MATDRQDVVAGGRGRTADDDRRLPGDTGVEERLLPMSDVLGRKWHAVIVYRLLEGGPMGFRDLESAVEGISSKMLSESLSTLEEDHGLVDREIVSDRPVRVEYSLTDRGVALEPVLRAMDAWSAEHG